MIRRHVLPLALLSAGIVQSLGGCAGARLPSPPPRQAPAALQQLVRDGLPPLASLGPGLTLRAGSAVNLSADGWQGAGNCSANATQAGTAVQLVSAPNQLSAAWYGVRATFNSLTVPYLPPYDVTVHTDAGGEFWVALADYRRGMWVTPPTPVTGASVSVPVTLDANAANVEGFFWLAVITYGGQSLRVDSIDLSYPDTPAVGDPVDYQQWVVAQDGVRLATDVYLPYAESGPLPDPPYPVLLLRLPYNKGFDSWAPPLTAQNIAVMIQFFRGRLDATPGWPNSEGEPSLFRDHAGPDHSDGVDTVSWLEARTWYNGIVVVNGPSAQGIAACIEATVLGDRLAGLNSQIGCADFGAFAATRNGCFKESILPSWIPGNGYPDSLLTEARDGFANGGYWEGVDFDTHAAGVGCPGYHTSGWWDIDVEATIKTWKQFTTLGQGSATGNQWLLIGPWSHDTLFGTTVGQLTFPSTGDLHDPSVIPYNWNGTNFRNFILGRDATYAPPTKRVRAYFIGEEGNVTAPQNTWYDLDDWPPALPGTEQTLYLDATKMLGGAVPATGTLAWDCDPLIPVPTVGGANFPSPAPFFIQAGPYDQSVIPDSSAVLKFSMAPIVSDWSFAGPFSCVLYVSTDQADTDVMAKLVDVYPGGREMLVTDSTVRLSWYLQQQGLGPVVPGTTYEVQLEIGQRAYVCAAGHRLELWIQSSNYPRYAINPGNGDAFLDATNSNAVTQHNTLHVGGPSPDCPSRLILPVFTPS